MMSVDRDKVRRRLAAIDDVLWRDWDPVGINDVPEARDEYSSYAPGVFRLLESGATDVDVMIHLSKIESDTMGLSPRPLHTLQPVIDALRAIITV